MWQGTFHALLYTSFFWKVPCFLKGKWVNRIWVKRGAPPPPEAIIRSYLVVSRTVRQCG